MTQGQVDQALAMPTTQKSLRARTRGHRLPESAVFPFPSVYQSDSIGKKDPTSPRMSFSVTKQSFLVTRHCD